MVRAVVWVDLHIQAARALQERGSEMQMMREFEVVCRGCKEVRRVNGEAIQACLMESACPACGDERQQVLRAVQGASRMVMVMRSLKSALHVPHFGGHARV